LFDRHNRERLVLLGLSEPSTGLKPVVPKSALTLREPAEALGLSVSLHEACVCLGPAMELKTDFENIIVKATKAEDDLMEASIKAEVVRERIKVWQGTGIIVDGHRRYRFAKKQGKPFEVEELQFEDRLAAEIWMHRLQLSRRNVSPDQYAYHTGKLYEAQKRREGRPNKLGKSYPVSKCWLGDSPQKLTAKKDFPNVNG
jgi:hypothetical protein